jgi:hypothetical protein
MPPRPYGERESLLLCDLCFNTQADGEGSLVIRSMNYVGNRILEAMRRG